MPYNYFVRVNEVRDYVRKLILEELESRKTKLRVFDFDDTLVKTRSRVHVTDEEGRRFDLTPGEFAIYEKKPGDAFDYTDFEKLIDPREIEWTVKILKRIASKGSEVVILTARGSASPVEQFLEDAGLSSIVVVALGSSDPRKKAEYIEKRIEEDGITHVEFFDDSYKNVEAVKSLSNRHPDVKIIARLISQKAELS